MRFIFLTTALAAVLTILCPAERAAAAESPAACAAAYYAAAEERGRVEGAVYNNQATESLMRLIPNASSLDFEARGNQVVEKAGLSGFEARASSLPLAAEMRDEGIFAKSSYYFVPDLVLETQRQVFERARTCDAQFGFMPQLGPVPSHAAILQHYKDLNAREDTREAARLAALDDQQCAIRFLIAGGLFPNNPQGLQAMQQRLVLAAKASMAAQPGMTQERLAAMIQSEGQIRAAKITTRELRLEFRQEVHACEIRYGQTLTDIIVN